MAIRYKLGLIMVGLSLIILFMFLVTWYTTSAQKADSLVINLAGRQRMLSQKMSKEIFLSATESDATQKDKIFSKIDNTMKVFDLTLTALINSGKAPLSLDLEDEYSSIPKSSEPAFSQLNKVKEKWGPFSNNIKDIIAKQENLEIHYAYIKNNNLDLLSEMNKAVGMLQKSSEKKVKRL
ncbi:MAG: hemerythrin, partial [Desulfobacteraceae bacterium]|nr:hemerythrin [Desulfobacteraceae bacterium]